MLSIWYEKSINIFAPSVPSEVAAKSAYDVRQSYYLRISATSVLQLILQMDPHHVSWMNDDIFDRMLFALRDKLPEKVLKDANTRKKHSLKEKLLVDVYRGNDFSLAYYLKRTPETHMVLLKDKQMVYAEGQLPTQRKNKNKKNDEPAPIDVVDLTADDTSEAAPSGEASIPNIPMEDEIKDELEDDLNQERPPLGEQDEDDDKDDEDEDEKIDQKPKLQVNYTGFQIYRSALIVVIQPFPDFKADQVDNRPLENNQLSASVQPESLQRASSSSSRFSATPVPSSRQGGALFRSRSRSYTAQMEDEEEQQNEEDTKRKRKAVDDDEENDEAETDEDDDVDQLPTTDQIFAAAAKYSRN